MTLNELNTTANPRVAFILADCPRTTTLQAEGILTRYAVHIFVDGLEYRSIPGTFTALTQEAAEAEALRIVARVLDQLTPAEPQTAHDSRDQKIQWLREQAPCPDAFDGALARSLAEPQTAQSDAAYETRDGVRLRTRVDSGPSYRHLGVVGNRLVGITADGAVEASESCADINAHQKRAAEVRNLFTYHPPTPDQVKKYEEFRNAAFAFALVLDAVVPNSADKSSALRHLRNAVMEGNAAIALQGKA